MKHLVALLLLGICSAAVAAPADPWLDRAAKDLRTLHEAPDSPDDPTLAAFLKDQPLGCHLVKLGRRDADRELLREIAAKIEQQFDAEKDPERKLTLGWDAAEAAFTAGDAAKARQLLAKASASLEASKLDQIAGAFSAGWTERAHQAARGRFGDLSDREIGDLPLEKLAFICRHLAAVDETANQAPFLKAGRAAADAATSPDRTTYREITDLLVYCGQTDEATTRAMTAPIDIRIDVLINLAIRLWEVGLQKPAAGVAAKAWSAVSALPPEERSYYPSHVLAWLVESDADRAMISSATDEVEQPLLKLKRRRLARERYTVMTLVKAAHHLKQAQRRDRWLGALEAMIATVPADDRCDAWIELAVLHVEVGRLDDALRLLDSARKEKAREYSWISAAPVAVALADRGDYEEAVALLREILPEAKDQRMDMMRIARGAIRRNEFQRAETLAKELIEPSDVLRVRRAIVMHRMRSGRTDGLAEWIDNVADARHRVVLNLSAAEEVLRRSIEAYATVLKIPG